MIILKLHLILSYLTFFHCYSITILLLQATVHKSFLIVMSRDLARDLVLLRKASKFLASRMHEKDLLEKGSKLSFFRITKGKFLLWE